MNPDLPQFYFVNGKKLGKGKLGQGKAKSSFTVSGRLITDDEIDLGQIYCEPGVSPFKVN